MSSFRSLSGARRYLLVFGLGCVLVLGVSEWMLRTWIVPIHDSRANRVHLVYTASQRDAVLGDSHLSRAFTNSDRFANLARPGSSPAALEIVAREYFRHLEPGRVIVQASPQLFTRRMQRRGAQRHDRWFTLNLGLPFAPYVFEPGIAAEIGAFLDWEELDRRTRDARGRKRTSGPILDREAARRRALSPAERVGEAAERLRQNQPVAGAADSAAFDAYLRLLDALIAKGARVCLAETPVTAEYDALAREDPRHVEVVLALRSAAEERRLPIVDFRDWPILLRADDFTNADHLTTARGGDYAAWLETACYGASGAVGPKSAPTR